MNDLLPNKSNNDIDLDRLDPSVDFEKLFKAIKDIAVDEIERI